MAKRMPCVQIREFQSQHSAQAGLYEGWNMMQREVKSTCMQKIAVRLLADPEKPTQTTTSLWLYEVGRWSDNIFWTKSLDLGIYSVT